MIALRLEESLEKEFTEAVEAEGKNRSQVLRQLMEEYLRRKRLTPAEVFKAKFNYAEGECLTKVSRPRMSKAELKAKVREGIVGT